MILAETTVPQATDVEIAYAVPVNVPEGEVRPKIYSSAELLQGRREAWIEHGEQMYRLRLTAAGKLYLTK